MLRGGVAVGIFEDGGPPHRQHEGIGSNEYVSNYPRTRGLRKREPSETKGWLSGGVVSLGWKRRADSVREEDELESRNC